MKKHPKYSNYFKNKLDKYVKNVYFYYSIISSEDNTSEDNTSEDNTSEDNTSEDNTSEDNTSEDYVRTRLGG